jgi:uncharacterized membrane protein
MVFWKKKAAFTWAVLKQGAFMNAFAKDQSHHDKQNRFASTLGWFSLGLGLAGIFMPRRLCQLMGIRANPFLIRIIGLREVASGAGLLGRRDVPAWLWTRVSGDMMDLGLLAGAFFSGNAIPQRVKTAAAAVAGITAVDAYCARQSTQPSSGSAICVTRSIIINRSPEELYNAWRRFEDLPRFMRDLVSVQELGRNRSHWVAKAPAGTEVEWDAEIVDEQPGRLIAWRSIEGSEVDTSGSVRFEPATGNRGTVVHVEMNYNPPGGAVGAMFAKLFAKAPEQRVMGDLHRFKQLMETGTITTTEGQPAGRPSSTSKIYDDLVRG